MEGEEEEGRAHVVMLDEREYMDRKSDGKQR